MITIAAIAKPIGPAPISLSENPNTLYSVTEGAEVAFLQKPSSSMTVLSVRMTGMVLDPLSFCLVRRGNEMNKDEKERLQEQLQR